MWIKIEGKIIFGASSGSPATRSWIQGEKPIPIPGNLISNRGNDAIQPAEKFLRKQRTVQNPQVHHPALELCWNVDLVLGDPKSIMLNRNRYSLSSCIMLHVNLPTYLR